MWKIKKKFGRNLRNFDRKFFSQDIKNVSWENILEIEKRDPNLSLEKLLTKMNTILDKHLPLKKLFKQEILQRDTPWITKGLTKSIKIKNVTHEKMRRAKDPIKKEELCNTYKT